MKRSHSVLTGLALAVLLAASATAWLRHHTSRFDELIAQAAMRHSVDFYLIKALIYEESWFRDRVRGTSGEYGLMQITVLAARDFTMQKGLPPIREPRLLEPRLNLEIGCWYLRQSIVRFRWTPDPQLFGLLRYNAGETRADQWAQLALAQPVPPGKSPEEFYLSFVDFPGTRDYTRRILRRARERNFWF